MGPSHAIDELSPTAIPSKDPSTHWTFSQATFYVGSCSWVYRGHWEHTTGKSKHLMTSFSGLTYTGHQDPHKESL